MSIAQPQPNCKPQELILMAEQLGQFVRQAAEQGKTLYEVEKSVWDAALTMGRVAVDDFLQLQGDGDLGETVQTEDGQKLTRSETPVDRPLRTVFGEHVFTAYVYSHGPKKKIALRPIDARLNLPEGKGSYLWEEFSQCLWVDQAFGEAGSTFATLLRQDVSVDTLERTNQRLGEQAEEFLNTLPAPPPEEEGELLVATADGKGVPLIRERPEATPVHGRKPPRPNNRRMATLACVYSVDPHVRGAEDVVAALFREERPSPQEAASRPRPCHKRMTACFPTVAEAGTEEETRIRGDVHAWTWASGQIDARRRPGQVLIRICDGQESLWAASDLCLGLDAQGEEHPPPDNGPVVDVLDIIHVTGYVWLAARAVCGEDEKAAERFVRARLLRILQGQASGVIRGMRQMATRRKLRGQGRKDLAKACNYLEKNLHRMRYDEYLAQGYPIASGVIEGACRHLVKDRMERTGMRWRESNAGRMLFVRAVAITGLWQAFQSQRHALQQAHLHPHRGLLSAYVPPIALAI